MFRARSEWLSSLTLPGYFGVKLVAGALLLKFSATFLSTPEFAVFSQFMFFSALLNMISAGGLQSGVILETAGARGNAEMEASIVTNGLAVCFAILFPSVLLSILLREEVSVLLLDTRTYAYAVPIVSFLSLAGGPGQLFLGLLSGRGRARDNLLSQTAGLVVSSAGALAFLYFEQPISASYAFASSSLVVGLTAFILSRANRLTVSIQLINRMHLAGLLRYSAALLTTASLFPLMLFVQRHLYLEAFGVSRLNDWLVANRISDLTTQFLALYMTHYFLAAYVAGDAAERAAAIRRAVLLGTGIMGTFLLFFAVLADWVIPIFLSAKFLSAAPKILLYMAGDILRVGTSIALHVALGSQRLRRYLGIEAAVVATFGIVTFGLIKLGSPWAPYMGYAGAYLAVTLASALPFLFSQLRRGSRSIPENN